MPVLFLALALFLGGAFANFYFLIFLWDSKMDIRTLALALIRASYSGESVAEVLGDGANGLPDSIIRQLELLRVERR